MQQTVDAIDLNLIEKLIDKFVVSFSGIKNMKIFNREMRSID